MPMIPQDMDACHRKTLRDQREKKIRQADHKERQKKLRAQYEKVLRDAQARYGEDAEVQVFLD